MKRLIYILFLCCLSNLVYAIIATPDPVWRQLPDGTWAEVYLHGDEYYHYMTTLSGERIAGSEMVWQRNEDGLDPAQRAVMEEMLTSYVPNQGVVKVPVILVNFTDLAFTMDNPQANFSDFYNGAGGTNIHSTGSVREYYIASSDSMLLLEFDVFGPYTLSRDMAYYGGNTGNNHMQHGSDLVVEAAKLASDAGIDLSPYDNDNDGAIDNLSIVVAGYNEAEGGHPNTIWPHFSTVYSSSTFSGKRLRGYLMISEYRGSGGKQQAGIGTYCHEFGHALGLPDLYDTQNSSRYTVGEWDVMCSGSYNNNGCTPPSYSAFERFAMGWLKPIQLEEIGDYRLRPLLQTNEAYLIAATEHNLLSMSPSPNEYFLIENRQAVGWDANTEALVGTGMLVSHITFNPNTWNRNTFNNSKVLGYAIVGAYDSAPSKSTAADLFPGTRQITSWLPTLNNGTELKDQQVQNIKQMGDMSIRFSYGPPSMDGIFFLQDELPPLVTTFDKRIIEYDTAYVDVLVRNLPCDSLVIYSTNNRFELSLDNGETWWQETSCLLPNDTICSFSMLIRYVPYRQECDIKTGFITIESTHSLKVQQLEVSGYSPRPMYITKPELLEPDFVSDNSFSVRWVGQNDAQCYYATLFSLQDGHSVESQTFDSFLTYASVEDAGWEANFFRVTSVVSESKYAVLFKESGEKLLSKASILPLSGVRFWISNDYIVSSNTTVGGHLLLEGKRSDGLWQEIDNIRVVNTTKNLIKDYTFSTSDSIVQLRFTYTHNGGEGGCAIDGFESYLDQTIQYICKDSELKLLAPDTSAVFYNLMPNTDYYFALQAYEEKGCSGNYSPRSDFQVIRTLSDEDSLSELQIIRAETGEYVVRLPEPANGGSELCVYTPQGLLIVKIAVPYKTTRITLPELPVFGMYYLKLIEDRRIQRKSPWGKLLYL